MRAVRARRDSRVTVNPLKIRHAIELAAGVMLQTLHRRGRDPWPADAIVHPQLRGEVTAGRFKKPGLDLAVDAMQALMVAEDLSVHAAAQRVARTMSRFWKDAWSRWATSSDDLERLNAATLAGQLRRAYYHRQRRRRRRS